VQTNQPFLKLKSYLMSEGSSGTIILIIIIYKVGRFTQSLFWKL